MSTTSTQTECYLLIQDQPISVHHFLLKDYSMTSPLVITLLIHCELSQCALLKLGETVRLVIKKCTDAMSIELLMTQKVMKDIVQSQSSAFYKLTLCSPFYLALQACINEVYPNQHAGDFIMTFIRHRIGAFIKYDLALSKHYQPKHRVAKQCSGYHFFRDTLLEEGIYFVSKIIEGKESLYFTDDLTRQLNDKVHQNLPYQRLEEQAKIGANRAIKQSILVETNHLNYWPGEHVELNGARYRIETISIEGWQRNHPLGVTGDFPTLKTSISLVPIDTPCHMVSSPKRPVLFQSARIHSTQKNGRYGILYDFLPRAARDQIVYKVKKNVSLTGKHIGCDMGLYPNTQVVLSILYRELASSIILGAFDVLDEGNKLKYKDNQTNYIQTRCGHGIIFQDGAEPPRLIISTRSQLTCFVLSKEAIELKSKTNDIHFLSSGLYEVKAESAIHISVEKNSRFISQGDLSIQSENGSQTWDVCQSMYIYAQNQLTIESQSIYLKANDAIRLHAEETLMMDGDNISLVSAADGITFRAPHLTITTQCFRWRCGATSLSVEKGQLTIIAPSTVVDGFMTALAS